MNWAHLIGTPFVWGGRDPAHGLDCWGLVLQLVPGLPDYSAADQAGAQHMMTTLRAEYRRVESPQPGDVLILGIGKRPHHAGVLVEPNLVVHASRPLGTVAQPLGLVKQSYPLIEAYRWP
jgi:cell wall-associated NlpC family hydrolase